jgi:hypothetical protein
MLVQRSENESKFELTSCQNFRRWHLFGLALLATGLGQIALHGLCGSNCILSRASRMPISPANTSRSMVLSVGDFELALGLATGAAWPGLG